MERLKIVARYRDGRMVKGTTNNFWPGKPSFHVTPLGSRAGEPPTLVLTDQLKAVFVVHDLAGNPRRREKRHFHGNKTTYGQKMEVTFEDGEVLEGTVLDYDPSAPGFFIKPADPESNNDRIYVLKAATKSVRPI